MSYLKAHLNLADSLGGYVDGAHTRNHGEEVQVEDPATTATIAAFADAIDDDVAAAVDSADRAYRQWSRVRGVRRGQILSAIADKLRLVSDGLARIETLDTGKPLRQSRTDVEIAARYFEFYAGVADKIYGSTIPGEGAYWSYTLREPYGVIGHITPWNSPLSQMCRGVAPSLAAGNTVVVKPSEVTPLSSLAAASLFIEAGLPPGVCNVIAGRGSTAGNALVRHPKISHLTFTGSVPTGKAVLRAAADRVVGCNLELGGKSPTIVFADADLAKSALAGAMAVVRNSGQSCFATTRLIVERSIVNEYTELVAAAMSGLTMGPGLEDRDLGPLASAGQLSKVLAAIESGKRDGARVVLGGSRAADRPGYFVVPTLLTEVRNDMSVARNEIFGPVQSILEFESEDEAITLANDSAYGLAAGVFTTDIRRAHRVARELEAGQVQVNGYPLGGVETPFGGYKESGMGREKGLAALADYTQLKTVIVSE